MTSRDDQSNSFLNSDTICDEFFIEIVEKKLNISRDDFKLRLVLLSPATGKNENYVAVLYRAKIKIELLATNERTSVDVIIKALLSTMPEMKEFGVFPRERFVYDNVLTSFDNIWLERAGEKIKFGPSIIKSESDPYEQLILEDLKAEGFEMLNRKVGLTMAQTKMVLTKIAKFHAASAIRYQKDGIIQNYFDRKASMPAMPENPEEHPMVAGFQKIFFSFTEAIKNYGDCDFYAAKIERWDFVTLMNQWMEIAAPMRSGFQVLNHGDLWLNNMMFRSDAEGNPIEVSLIDYQTPFWAGPGADLLYFLISSVADDIKIDHFDDFVEYYHSELDGALQKLKYDQPIPTLTEVHIDLLEKGAFAASCLMIILFVVKYESNEEINLEILFKGGSDDPGMMDRIYNNDNFKKAIKLWLPFLNKRGYLDSLIKPSVLKVDEKTEE